jgi:hypothetical protein
MKSADRQRAQRVADYADSLVVSRRTNDDQRSAAFLNSDREFPALAELAATLTAIRIDPPAGIETELARRLTALEARPCESQLRMTLINRCRKASRLLWRGVADAASLPTAKPITAVAVNLLVIAVTFATLRSPSASAAEILARTDAALASLVEPGKILFRRWRIVERIRDRPGAPERIEHRFLMEWIDGSDIRHATGKSTTPSGRTYLAFANLLQGGHYSPRIFYEPGYANEAAGLLSVVPSREEFEEAVTRFTGTDRRILETYLARGYIYEPIFSERRFNQAMLNESAAVEPLQRVRLSVEDSVTPDGRPVYKVRSFDDVRLQFRWRSSGPPVMWLERQETVRYISKDTYLAVRSEEIHLDEMGTRIDTTRELVDVVNLDKPVNGPDVFDLNVPSGVPVRRQSAYDHLVEVLRALRRAPRFLSRTH